MYQGFLIHSFTDGPLGCFQTLAIVNAATKNLSEPPIVGREPTRRGVCMCVYERERERERERVYWGFGWREEV